MADILDAGSVLVSREQIPELNQSCMVLLIRKEVNLGPLFARQGACMQMQVKLLQTPGASVGYSYSPEDQHVLTGIMG